MDLEQSFIYCGRISVEELEYYLRLEKFFELSGPPETAEEAKKICEEFLSALHRALGACHHTRALWSTSGFKTTHELSNSSHSSASVGKLFLHEAGALLKGASGRVPTMEESETFRKERKAQSQYVEETGAALNALSESVNALTLAASDTIHSLESGTPNDFNGLLQNAGSTYHSLVQFVLRHLPGRTFLNTLHRTPTQHISVT